MFAVIHTTSMPDHLRGYLSRFLQQSDTGLYIGMITPKVADQLWTKILDNCKDANVTLITSDPTRENGYQIRTSGSSRVKLVDRDGITMPAIQHA